MRQFLYFMLMRLGGYFIPVPTSHFRITDNNNFRITDDGNNRITDGA